ncbi:MAG: RnfABCDGE type electron transport complex subunit G [Treponema sp.]|nr:RnfABCDGE type electron transport complex subunit G [Treponema sp.]
MKTNFLGMIKLGLILAAFAAAACVMLAFVYSGTSEVIAQRQKTDLDAALKELFPDADKFEKIDGITSPDNTVAVEESYAAYKNGKITGAALRVSRASYNGQIKSMVGVSADGFITGVKILEHSDTPGLGANAASSSYFVDRAKGITFYGQFAGKKITDPHIVKSDVIAITASTITSRAVSASVKAAGLAVHAWLTGEDADAVTSASGEEE